MRTPPNTITFHMSKEAKEVMRLTADAVIVSPDVSVDEAAAAVIAALEQHMRNIVAAEREACAAVAESRDGEIFPAIEIAAAIRARGEKE
jgi:hypothetical protein